MSGEKALGYLVAVGILALFLGIMISGISIIQKSILLIVVGIILVFLTLITSYSKSIFLGMFAYYGFPMGMFLFILFGIVCLFEYFRLPSFAVGILMLAYICLVPILLVVIYFKLQERRK